ncbi:hypothetical protein FDECE_9925 [Fusarium decemcellulare]|nr:hypothetical protein FDECE_9925 [Fusarium decemcellulare]
MAFSAEVVANVDFSDSDPGTNNPTNGFPQDPSKFEFPVSIFSQQQVVNPSTSETGTVVLLDVVRGVMLSPQLQRLAAESVILRLGYC